jgi:predicted nucleic acid-binding protein
LTIYADTSFFVSLYISDRHSAEAQKRIAQHARLWLTPLHRAEWAHAVSQHVFQRKISAREAQQVFRHFEQDRAVGLWLEAGVPETAFEACIEIARRHVSRLGARTLDSLHVASAVELKADRFWTFDNRQSKLAEAEGLQLA